MIILGIDPSLETGMAIVDTKGPTLRRAVCVKPGTKIPSEERLDWITDACADWAFRQWDDFIGWDLVAIEHPTVGRRAASPKQWRLIGRLEETFRQRGGAPVVSVTVGEVKRVVGLKHTDKHKPVREVEELLRLNHPIADTKYAREACSDAVAVAMAAHAKRNGASR